MVPGNAPDRVDVGSARSGKDGGGELGAAPGRGMNDQPDSEVVKSLLLVLELLSLELDQSLVLEELLSVLLQDGVLRRRLSSSSLLLFQDDEPDEPPQGLPVVTVSV